MDQFARVIRDIQARTSDDRLHWVGASPAACERILLNPERVMRVHRAEYDLGSRRYQLLFVERKVERHGDFGDVDQGSGFELLVLDDHGHIVLALYDGIVDRDDLVELAGLIDVHNVRAKEFFAAFEAMGNT